MYKYNVMILAGGHGGPLAESTGIDYKAMIPIHGKTMLARVVEAYAASANVDRIVVVGPSELDELDCMRHVRKRIPAGINLIQNVLTATGYIKTRLYKGADHHAGYLISYGDAVFLTTEIIDATIEAWRADPADVHLVYVEKGTYDRAGIKAKRTYVPIEGNFYTGGTMCYLKRMSPILSHVRDLHHMRKARKQPGGILGVLGCEGKGLREIESVVGDRLGVRVRVHVSPYPEMGMDVDKPDDLESAEQMLAP